MKRPQTIAAMASAQPSWRIGIVYSSFYKTEIDSMVKAAVETLVQASIPAGNISRHEAAGSFEIPLIGAALAKAKKADALIALGIIVEGETHHARLLAEQAARGIMDVQLTYHIPFAFEVLYVRTLRDARGRSSGKHNKGAEAALAVLYSLAELGRLGSSNIE